ncbi:MAG: hypothetical protein ACYTFQ_21580 [Planctomycetota bacterium]|jgi:hypothetical protein
MAITLLELTRAIEHYNREFGILIPINLALGQMEDEDLLEALLTAIGREEPTYGKMESLLASTQVATGPPEDY